MTSQRIALLLLAVLAASGARAATIELTVNGLVCGFCAQGIEKTLRRNAATDDVFVSLENRLSRSPPSPIPTFRTTCCARRCKDAGYDVKAIARTDRSLQSLREQMKARK